MIADHSTHHDASKKEDETKKVHKDKSHVCDYSAQGANWIISDKV
jgi:hypothetical protein